VWSSPFQEAVGIEDDNGKVTGLFITKIPLTLTGHCRTILDGNKPIQTTFGSSKTGAIAKDDYPPKDNKLQKRLV
jgi:hypothetical protein